MLVQRLLNNESSKLNITLTQEIKVLFWIYISKNIIRIGVTLLLENNPKIILNLVIMIPILLLPIAY
jgi:hypothetical protein